MSNIVVVETDPNILEIETITSNDLPNITIEIINTEKVLASDLPDDIPFSKITGNIPVNRIDGLDDYLDSYAFDCGTPT